MGICVGTGWIEIAVLYFYFVVFGGVLLSVLEVGVGCLCVDWTLGKLYCLGMEDGIHEWSF